MEQLPPHHRRATPSVAFAITIVAAIALVHCGGSMSPSGPTSALPAVSAVTLNTTSVAAGTSAQGTVTLTAPAPAGGAAISLSSSDPAIATVQTPVTIAAGSTSAAFAVAGVTAGTTSITASLNGSRGQSPTLTVTAERVALASISVGASSVVGGHTVSGAVTLTAAAPAGGAVVSLSSADPIMVPASVTVPTGSTTATFTILTRAVGGTISSTIVGAYGGTSASTTLSVTRPTVATASFGVTGPSQTDTCTMADDGNTLNCTFDGSTSTAPGTIVAWDWSYRVATAFAQTTSGQQLARPGVNCSLMPPPPLPAGVAWFTMSVTLAIHDNLGNVSAEVTNGDIRLLPHGVCGF